MKHNLYINHSKMREWGIRNINQAHIFDLLTVAPTWAETVIIDDEVYYWVARQKIVEELWILDIKPDTAYRHLKKLEEFGVIDYVKHGKKDCIRITERGKKYISATMSEMNPNYYVGNESEKQQNSEMNPRKLGNESEFHSDLNPTYTTTKINPTTTLSESVVATTSPSMQSAIRVAKYLEEKILSNKPNFKKKGKWEKDIDLAIRIDKRSESELVGCIEWIYSGTKNANFWVPNVMSGKKLREHFDKMEMQMMSEKKSQKNMVDTIYASGMDARGMVKEMQRREGVI